MFYVGAPIKERENERIILRERCTCFSIKKLPVAKTGFAKLLRISQEIAYYLREPFLERGPRALYIRHVGYRQTNGELVNGEI